MFLISFSGAHILAIVIATVVTQVIGMIWYSQRIGFGKRWMGLVGIAEEMKTDPVIKKNMSRAMIFGMFVGLVMVTGLATLHNIFILFSLFDALKLALLVWVTFIGAGLSMNYLYNPKTTMQLFLIDAGYHLVAMLSASVVLFFLL